jgi:hypothetical protein
VKILHFLAGFFLDLMNLSLFCFFSMFVGFYGVRYDYIRIFKKNRASRVFKVWNRWIWWNLRIQIFFSSLKSWIFDTFCCFCKCNGIQPKETEDNLYKYFIGPGNNSELICKLLKSRSKWRRSYSCMSANFIWTAVKKSSIFEFLEKNE